MKGERLKVKGERILLDELTIHQDTSQKIK